MNGAFDPERKVRIRHRTRDFVVCSIESCREVANWAGTCVSGETGNRGGHHEPLLFGPQACDPIGAHIVTREPSVARVVAAKRPKSMSQVFFLFFPASVRLFDDRIEKRGYNDQLRVRNFRVAAWRDLIQINQLAVPDAATPSYSS